LTPGIEVITITVRQASLYLHICLLKVRRRTLNYNRLHVHVKLASLTETAVALGPIPAAGLIQRWDQTRLLSLLLLLLLWLL